MRWLLISFVSFQLYYLKAQDTALAKPFVFSGYIETYYGYDFGKPESNKRPSFLYNHKQHNQVNVNLVYLKFAYAKNRFRFTLVPMLGTYSQSNLAGEPFYLRQIFEANVGIKLLKKKELWIDAGVLPSHIGFESAISKDCATLSRSMLAENSPYFETGIKLTYGHSSKWTFALLVVNGWQRIYWPKGKSLPSFGTQTIFKPRVEWLLNYSSFIGTDDTDSNRRMRYFHNLYAIWQVAPKLSFTAGFDIGVQQKSKHSLQYHVWYTPVMIVRYQPLAQLAMAVRYEFYSDKNGAIVQANTPNGFQTHGTSLNLDYIICPKVLWRVEGKWFKSIYKQFTVNGSPSSLNFALLTSLSLSLSK